MFVTVNVSFNTYACHEVHFVAKLIWSRTYVPKSSRHEVTLHRAIRVPFPGVENPNIREFNLFIIQVYEILAVSDGRVFIIMDYASKGDLLRYIQKE